jgi:hypothetical protein
MPETASIFQKLSHTPEWFFRWRGLKASSLPMVFAVLIVASCFALFLGGVRLKVVPPRPIIPRKASVIYLKDDALGRALALKAQEGGPFPSRFEPSQWEGMAALEAEVLAVARSAPIPYVPKLDKLPEEKLAPRIDLATKGEPVFPKRNRPSVALSGSAQLKIAPILYPLSGITPAELPADLPKFNGTIDSAMTAASWRFLVRLNPEGVVAECVSLEKGGEAGARELEAWLRSVHFVVAPGKPFRWIGVAVLFSNQPVDGPDAH